MKSTNKNIKYILKKVQSNGIKSLNHYQIKLLFKYLNDNGNDANLIKSFSLKDLQYLVSKYRFINEMDTIKQNIMDSEKFYKDFDYKIFYKKDLFNFIANPINLKDLQIKQSKFKGNKTDYHKFIKSYDLFKFIDMVYNPFFNKSMQINLNCKEKDLKDFIIKNLNLDLVKIDTDLYKSNKYKFKGINHISIKLTYYDNDFYYLIANKNDLMNLNISYSYNFNNLLSYLMDTNIKSYFKLFNDNKTLSKVFKYKNYKGFNTILTKKGLNKPLQIEKDYKYANPFYTFDNILDLDLGLNTIDLDLDSYFKQIDLDLISIDNDNDYNTLIFKVFNQINDLLIDLSFNPDYMDLEYKESQILKDLHDLSDLEWIDNDYMYYLNRFNLIIDYMDLYNQNQFLLMDLDNIESKRKDLNLLNQILDILQYLYKDTLKDYDLKDLNNITLKNHNTIFKNSIYDFNKVCYDCNNTKFIYLEKD